MTAHCEIATDFAATLGFGRNVQEAVHYQYEHYDRRGSSSDQRVDGNHRPAQVMHVALAVEIARSLFGAGGAAAMVRQRTGSYFDPEVAEAYLDLAEGLWPPDFDPIPLAEVLSCDPGTSAADLSGDRRSAVCEAMGDFADLKSARRGRHSHAVARLAVEIAGRLGLSQFEQDRLYRAGLVHDLGKVAVPYRLLEQVGDDTSVSSDRAGEAGFAEPVRLHPYYAQRILSRVRPLADLAAEVGAHHERIDGSGYPFGLGGEAVPIGARILGVATSAERAGNEPQELSAERGLDPECVAALGSAVKPGSGSTRSSLGATPGLPVLSSRELEVMHRLAAGASNPDISNDLYISRRTVEHHVERILRKLGVSSRTAAVAYALTHGLLD
jgi:DNA-binding CsgD family transcriptional regulator